MMMRTGRTGQSCADAAAHPPAAQRASSHAISRRIISSAIFCRSSFAADIAVIFRHHSGTEATRETAERVNSATLLRATVDRALMRPAGGDRLSAIHAPVTLMRRFILASLACAALFAAPFVDASRADASAASNARRVRSGAISAASQRLSPRRWRARRRS
ncbi:MAG: hypothetical protein K2Y27_14090 [Xanthobacteraceae bacterium]|nr:hypothetical protein [Xanthobacteraceae bacterium]